MNPTQSNSVDTKDPEREAFDRLHLKTEGPPSFITWSRWNECEKRAAWEAWQARALLGGSAAAPAASELLGYAPKHDDLLKGIRDNLNIMLASAQTHSDGDFVSGYTIKTGALHRIIGLLQIAGFPVIVPAAPAAPASPEARDALLTDEMLEVGRLAIEDALVELRDSRIAVLGRGNGLVIRESDGSESSIIRFGPETALRIGIKAMLAAMAASKEPQA